MNNKKVSITVKATIQLPIEKTWLLWTAPEHITKWNAASDDWHTTHAVNDLRAGGKFVSRMEAKDGSIGFDFGGIYSDVKPLQTIAYTMSDGRKVSVLFRKTGAQTTVTETFEAEDTNPVEMQRGGWQSILNNFKKYAENS